MEEKIDDRGHLSLSRQCFEVVVITLPDGRKIDVMVQDIWGVKVRLLFVAPRDVTIMREELLEDKT